MFSINCKRLIIFFTVVCLSISTGCASNTITSIQSAISNTSILSNQISSTETQSINYTSSNLQNIGSQNCSSANSINTLSSSKQTISSKATASSKAKSTSSSKLASSVQIRATSYYSNHISLNNFNTPDEIIYFHDGKYNIFTKDNPKFQNIIKLNNQRDSGNVRVVVGEVSFCPVLLSSSVNNYIQLNSIALQNFNSQQNNLHQLVYQYNDSEKTIGFYLFSTDGIYGFYIRLTQYANSAQLYGPLNNCDLLVKYLNS